MLSVRIITDTIELPERAPEYRPDSLLPFLQDHFGTWPETARLYHENVAQDRDVTPQTEEDIKALENADGVYYVVVYPGDPVTILVASFVAVFALAAIIYVLTPPIPAISQRNTQATSSNNALGDRQNKPRPNGRIPDIFGQVISIPELLTVPWRLFKNNVEVELSYMCVGRGSYVVEDIRDDTTPVSQIPGTSIEVYGPGTSPNSGVPDIVIGDVIAEQFLAPKRSNSVNGQTLPYPEGNSSFSIGCRFVYPNVIEATATTNVQVPSDDAIEVDPETGEVTGGGYQEIPTDLRAYFEVGNTIRIETPSYTEGSTTVDLAGDYLISGVTETEIFLSSPEAINDDWEDLDDLTDDATGFAYTSLMTLGDGWIGPFNLIVDDLTQVFSNFVAPGGLYKDDGTNQYPMPVNVEVELTPIDEDGVAIGASVVFPDTVPGSGVDRDARGMTLFASPVFSGPMRVRARRTTPKDSTFKGQVVDDVKWRDLYAMTPIDVPHFGDVTTIRSMTVATPEATAQKERKLNCRVTRKVLVRNEDDTFGPDLAPSQNAADILCHVSLDPYIGARTLNELDVPQIYATITAVEDYFGIVDPSQFNYTFDQDNLSFEDIVKCISQAVFCEPYRQGNRLKLHFERETDDSTILFNHRNKLPGSEVRSVRFGVLDDADGVEFDYVSPRDGATVTLYIPADRTATKAKKIEIAGVASARTAYLHAWRAWNKLRYQNITTQFDALGEATQLVRNERIEISDDTRPDVYSGYIVDVVGGLGLRLSQPAPEEAGEYYLFRQLPSGGIETLVVNTTGDPFLVLLSEAPATAIVIDPDISADTTYEIVGPSAERSTAFLLTEKGSYDKRSLSVTAINYDSRYYQNDSQYR